MPAGSQGRGLDMLGWTLCRPMKRPGLSVLGHLEAETRRPDQMLLLPAPPQLLSPHPAWGHWGDTARPPGVGTPSGRLLV